MKSVKAFAIVNKQHNELVEERIYLNRKQAQDVLDFTPDEVSRGFEVQEVIIKNK